MKILVLGIDEWKRRTFWQWAKLANRKVVGWISNPTVPTKDLVRHSAISVANLPDDFVFATKFDLLWE